MGESSTVLVTGASGYVAATISVFKITDAVLGTVDEVTPTAAGNSNTGNLFLYDPDGEQHITSYRTRRFWFPNCSASHRETDPWSISRFGWDGVRRPCPKVRRLGRLRESLCEDGQLDRDPR